MGIQLQLNGSYCIINIVSASKPSPTSPPYPPPKKTFTSLSSLPTSPNKIMQDQPIQHISSPLPSSTSSTVSPNTVLHTTAEFHHPSQNLHPLHSPRWLEISFVMSPNPVI